MKKIAFEVRENEKIFAERISAYCWNSPLQTISRQISGKVYFIDQRIAFYASGLIGTTSVSWEIAYKDIMSVKKCMTPPFFPFGVLIEMKDGTKYKLGIMKRNKYIGWILQHIS